MPDHELPRHAEPDRPGRLNPSRLVSETIDASQINRVFTEMSDYKTRGMAGPRAQITSAVRLLNAPVICASGAGPRPARDPL
jgi:hypothetical protein